MTSDLLRSCDKESLPCPIGCGSCRSHGKPPELRSEAGIVSDGVGDRNNATYLIGTDSYDVTCYVSIHSIQADNRQFLPWIPWSLSISWTWDRFSSISMYALYSVVDAAKRGPGNFDSGWKYIL